MKNTPEKIKALRCSKGYSQDYMANRLNISQKQYSRLESGETQLKILHLEEISQELGVGIDYFFSPSIQQENNHQSGGIANIAETIVNHQSPKAFEQVLKNQEKTIELLQQLIGKG